MMQERKNIGAATPVWVYPPRIINGQKLGKDPDKPYLTRWVMDFGIFAIRIHHWTGSDDLRAPHCHAWDFLSLLVEGSLTDRTPGLSGGFEPDPTGQTPPWINTPRLPGTWTLYPAEHRHSVVVGSQGAWTILLTGPERREWGFYVPLRGGKQKGRVRFRHRNKYFHSEGHH